MRRQPSKKQRGIFEKNPNSGVWWIQYYANGCRHREKVGLKSVAIARYQQRKTEAREGRLPALPRRVPFDALVHEYLETVRGRLRSFPILTIYARRWIEVFSTRPLTSILPMTIERCIAQREQEVAPATVNRELAFLKRVFAVALKNKFISENPAKEVKFLREPSGRVRWLSDEEEVQLHAEVAEADWKIIAFAIYTGLRRGEQFGLRWDKIDLANHVATIPRSKHGGVRHVPLNDTAMAILLSLPSRSHSPWVFASAIGKTPLNAPNFVHRVFDPALRRAKVEDFRWHDLRHTFASRLAMKGVSLHEIKELLGHKTLAMTLRYAHLSPTHLHHAVRQLDAGGSSGGSTPTHNRAPELTHSARKPTKSR